MQATRMPRNTVEMRWTSTALQHMNSSAATGEKDAYVPIGMRQVVVNDITTLASKSY